MKLLAINQKTAEWLLAKKEILGEINNNFGELFQDIDLAKGLISKGPLRLSSNTNNNITALWNSDYISYSGYEEWGFLLADNNYGFINQPEIMEEVLERMLSVINQRLQNLLLPHDFWIHRSLGEGMHTCLSGRGETARQKSIGWYENNFEIKQGKSRGLICIGPIGGAQFDVSIKSYLNALIPKVPIFIEEANNIIATSFNKPVIEPKYLNNLSSKYFPIKSLNNAHIEPEFQLDSDDGFMQKKYETLEWDYFQWVAEDSFLTPTQRNILDSDKLLKHPLRIIGAAGSGKSLLMQLLAMKRLYVAKEKSESIRILYIVHNKEMQRSMEDRFESLGAFDFMINDEYKQRLTISTLFDHCIKELNLPVDTIYDKDASNSKRFQKEKIREIIISEVTAQSNLIKETKLLSKIIDINNDRLLDIFTDILISEIGVTIKGKGSLDRKIYVESEKPLSRFHGLLEQTERDILYDIYLKYHEQIFDEMNILDSDDVAISYLLNLKTPFWEIRRKSSGFDFVFVDETQLFNQNERQLFRLLTKGNAKHLPIAIAIDEAQDIRGSRNIGFGLLGFEDLENEVLTQVHRSTEAILKLAFFFIQRTTDLFSNEFPDYTKETVSLIQDTDKLAKMPKIITRREASTLSKTIIREIKRLRKENLRTIGLVIHAERYWNEITTAIRDESNKEISNFPFRISERRGEIVDSRKPLIYIAKPEHVGGQEFDAVIAVGLEHNVAPPQVPHAGLSESLEQQMLREMYLVFSRARYQLLVINSKNSMPNGMLQSAIKQGYIEVDNQ